MRGCVAVERGPLVLCLESVDLPDGDVNDVEWHRRDPQERQRRHHAAPAAPEAGARRLAVRRRDDDAVEDLGEVALVPYQEWGNRGPGTMRIWLPVGR